MNEYISYARSHVTPTISDEAAAAMCHGYVEMRKSGVAAGKKTIAATARQLESIIRMSEAHTRLRLSEVVTADDVHEAIRLINVATQRAVMDPRTGTINMDLITTGHTCVFATPPPPCAAYPLPVRFMLHEPTFPACA